MNQNKFGHQLDISSMQKYLKENENNNVQYDGPSWWNIPSGMSSVRILPPWDATGRVALAVYSHPIEFQGKGMKYKKYSWTCVNRTFGKPCNICNGLGLIKEAGVDVSGYEPTRRVFYLNAIVMYDPDYDKDIKSGKSPENCYGAAPGTHVLMRAPKTVYDWIVSNITNPLVGDITSVTNGIDILITKDGQGLGTSYQCTLSPNGRTAIPQEYLDKIESLYNLDEVFSTGFEQEQIDELVASLSRSSQAMSAGITNMSNQMSGQFQNPPQQFNPPQFSNPQNPMNAPSFGAGFAPNSMPNVANGVGQTPYGAISNPPSMGNPGMFTPNQVPTPSAPAQQRSDVPDCFGKGYNPTDVKCVTCSHEILCSQRSSK